MSIRTAFAILVAAALLGGCEATPDPGAVDTTPRWDLPEGLQAAFNQRFPDSRVVTWNRQVGAYDDVSYHIFFVSPDGQRRDVWFSPTGQVIPPPSPWEDRGEP